MSIRLGLVAPMVVAGVTAAAGGGATVYQVQIRTSYCTASEEIIILVAVYQRWRSSE